ncbi:MAG: family 43 glycosylhydrolase [Halanaerobium sp.]
MPDAEPYVFDDRVYIYGSHDRFNGHAYCLNNYICWSAPVEALSDWRYEGVIYKKKDDPLNPDSRMYLYAPDLTVGPDGRYYLYYVLDKAAIVSVAVSDNPASKFEFYGYVHYPDGTRLGEKEGDQPQFDPGVITEGEKTCLYTGFCQKGDKSRNGAMATVLDSDMLTIIEEPKFVIPSEPYSDGTGFEGHEFFEAPSIRKRGDTYYLIYSSILMHELCYAISQNPTEGFKYQGTIVSNADLCIDSYKPAEKPMYYGGNNHGSIVEIKNQWYIFYHRHTNGTNFSRQACLEKIEFTDQGQIQQVEMTSCGSKADPLLGVGEYTACLACNLFTDEESVYTDFTGTWMNKQFPKITQDGKDGNKETGYIQNMKDSATAAFKYFDCHNIKKLKIKVRGYCSGSFKVKTAWGGEVLAEIPVKSSNIWQEYTADIEIPAGVQPLYFTYRGEGSASLASFTLLPRL